MNTDRRIPWDIIWPLTVGWGAYALFRMAQTVLLGSVTPPGPLQVTQRIMLSFADGGLMAAMTPAAVWAAGRFTIDRRHLHHFLVHFVIGAVLSAIGMAALRALGEWVTHTRIAAPFAEYYLRWVTGNLFAYFLVVAATHAMLSDRRAREERVRTARLEGQLATARLDALRAQLHPHFLFNTLHAIAELVHTDPNAADAMITRLGHLLRHALDASEATTISLDDELAYVAAYLDIHRVRMSDRLNVAYDVADDARDASVPPLLLQPLVENAIEHGIADAAGGGTITIAAHRAGDHVRITVADDGLGAPQPIVDGVGLGNTRRRLREIFGDDQSLATRAEESRGFEAVIMIPFSRNRPPSAHPPMSPAVSVLS